MKDLNATMDTFESVFSFRRRLKDSRSAAVLFFFLFSFAVAQTPEMQPEVVNLAFGTIRPIVLLVTSIPLYDRLGETHRRDRTSNCAFDGPTLGAKVQRNVVARATRKRNRKSIYPVFLRRITTRLVPGFSRLARDDPSPPALSRPPNLFARRFCHSRNGYPWHFVARREFFHDFASKRSSDRAP